MAIRPRSKLKAIGFSMGELACWLAYILVYTMVRKTEFYVLSQQRGLEQRGPLGASQVSKACKCEGSQKRTYILTRKEYASVLHVGRLTFSQESKFRGALTKISGQRLPNREFQ